MRVPNPFFIDVHRLRIHPERRLIRRDEINHLPVWLQPSTGCQEIHGFAQGLGNEKTVKWIFVMERETCNQGRMAHGNRKRRVPVPGKDSVKRKNIEIQFKSPDGRFYGQFPHTCRTDVNLGFRIQDEVASPGRKF
jgi:hypothetical protein